MYPSIKLASQWVMGNSVDNKYGLPWNLINTFDEHSQMGNVNTYNSMTYITGLSAMIEMSTYMNDTEFVGQLNVALQYAKSNLTKLLWNSDAGFYRSYWCENGYYPEYGLQGDVLYGYLWSKIVNISLDDIIDRNTITSHILSEQKYNLSPYGIQFMFNRTTNDYNCNPNGTYNSGFKDRDTWEMMGLNSASNAIYMDLDINENGLNIAQLIIDKYRLYFNDQWDFRDLSSTYNDSTQNVEYSRPVCNSHYSRQMIMYSLVYALNGISLDHRNPNGAILQMKPKLKALPGQCYPVLIPQSIFLVCPDISHNCYQINGLFGQIKLYQFIIFDSIIYNISIQHDITTSFCIN